MSNCKANAGICKASTDVVDLRTGLTEVKTELKHVNKRLDGIDDGMKHLQQLMISQNNLQKDMNNILGGHIEMKEQLTGFGRRLTATEGEIHRVAQKLENIPKLLKVNIFDYIWKYATVAIGAFITLKVSGLLPF